MQFQKIRLDKLNLLSIPLRLNPSESPGEGLKESLKATEGLIDPVVVCKLVIGIRQQKGIKIE